MPAIASYLGGMPISTKPSRIANHLAHYSSSPGGEDRGEGELCPRGRQSALTFVFLT